MSEPSIPPNPSSRHLQQGTRPSAEPRHKTALVVATIAIVSVAGLVLLGLAHPTPPTPDEIHSAVAGLFPSEFPSEEARQEEARHDGDIEQYLIERPVGARLITGVPAERRLNPAAAAGVLGTPTTASTLAQAGFRDGFARAWIDDQGDHVLAVVARFDTDHQARALADSLTASYQTAVGSTPDALTGFDSGVALAGTRPGKGGLITSVAIGQVADMTTLIVLDQPAPARIQTLDDLLEKERAYI